MISRKMVRTAASASGPGLVSAMRSQHLRFALRAIDVAVLDLADAMRQLRPLGEQAQHVVVDAVDALAQLGEFFLLRCWRIRPSALQAADSAPPARRRCWRWHRSPSSAPRYRHPPGCRPCRLLDLFIMLWMLSLASRHGGRDLPDHVRHVGVGDGDAEVRFARHDDVGEIHRIDAHCRRAGSRAPGRPP